MSKPEFTLSYNEAAKALEYAYITDQPIALVGPPGVGKSALVNQLAHKRNREVCVLLLSQCEPTDIGGFPVANHGQLDRLPLGQIKRACQSGVDLFLDEFTNAPPAVQGAAMRLVYERYAGDARLHPDTRIICAMNPPDQSAGGFEMALPLIGRMTMIHFHPSLQEVADYFMRLGSDESTLRSLGVDLGVTLEVESRLIELEPPAGSQAEGKPWGSPRSWERALRIVAGAIDAGENFEQSKIIDAILMGNVGAEPALSYAEIRKVRANLPSIKEIGADPEKAKLPQTQDARVAAIGLICQVALKHKEAAWIYAVRLPKEFQASVARPLLSLAKMDPDGKGKWHQKASEARVKIMGLVARALEG